MPATPIRPRRARSSRSRRFVAVVAVGLLTSMIAAACADDSNASDGGSSTTAGGTAKPGTAKPAGTVKLVTYADYALPEDAVKSFEAETGLKVELVPIDDAGAALSQVMLTAGSPPGDVFFGVDNTFLTKAQGSDAFAKYSPKATDDVPEEFRLDDTGRFTPVDESTVCVDYDKSWFADHHLDPPADLDALTDTAYRNLLVVENPALSSPGLAFLAATHATAGDDADDYWRSLKENGVLVVGSWGDAWESRFTVNGGDRPLVVSYASSPPAEVVYSETGLTEPKSAVIESTCFRQVEFASLLAGAPNAAGGKLLIDAMLSQKWQEGLPLSNFVFPVRPDTKLPEEFTKWAVHPADPIQMDAAEIGEQREAWIDEWRAIME